MGQTQYSSASPSSPPENVSNRFPPRICLRKDCGRIFDVRCWNQRYCQDPECLRLVRRWLAAKRQQLRRQQPEVRKQRATAAREARQRRTRPESRPLPIPEPVAPVVPPDPPVAWSRSRKNPGPICDRIGCYESPRPSCRCPARYCGEDCREAMQRVRDRERKSLWRKTFVGKYKRQIEAQKRKTARRASKVDRTSAEIDDQMTAGSNVVLPYRLPAVEALPCGDRKEDIFHEVHDPETTVTAQSRPPPAS